MVGPTVAWRCCSINMYKQAFTNSAYGYGMAIGVVTFLFSFLVAMLISHVTRREVLQY